ncbi:hypothetical protein AXF42_Ash001133 [Apostasia shenzhenica]|uniref:Uncharacterized protein n=1 Tax=Apostasia shenzhenica TaxID=1088818 RepID=A0A2I0AU23_9ASPA|nr:hypothetical protein AXF42_Ash001133 [Apostasia shenzhenica]
MVKPSLYFLPTSRAVGDDRSLLTYRATEEGNEDPVTSILIAVYYQFFCPFQSVDVRKATGNTLDFHSITYCQTDSKQCINVQRFKRKMFPIDVKSDGSSSSKDHRPFQRQKSSEVAKKSDVNEEYKPDNWEFKGTKDDKYRVCFGQKFIKFEKMEFFCAASTARSFKPEKLQSRKGKQTMHDIDGEEVKSDGSDRKRSRGKSTRDSNFSVLKGRADLDNQ